MALVNPEAELSLFYEATRIQAGPHPEKIKMYTQSSATGQIEKSQVRGHIHLEEVGTDVQRTDLPKEHQ